MQGVSGFYWISARWVFWASTVQYSAVRCSAVRYISISEEWSVISEWEMEIEFGLDERAGYVSCTEGIC